MITQAITRLLKPLFATAALAAGLALTGGCASTDEGSAPAVSKDGLDLVKQNKHGAAYVEPGAKFDQYKRVAIIDVAVAFKKDWMRDQNRDRMGLENRITQKDADRIKAELAAEFKKVFTEELTRGGYPVVEYEGVDNSTEDLLVLRPAIVNLDVTAPDLRTPGINRTWTQSAGSMTIILEAYDAVTSSLLARVMDAEGAMNMGRAQISNSVTNKAEADRILRKWAKWLVTELDRVHGKS